MSSSSEARGDLAQVQQLLADLLNALHAQAKEIERLTVHVERHTDRLLQPSQMALLISELSGLLARTKSWQGDKA